MPLLSPQVCPVMVGRDSELAVLTGLLDRASAGEGSLGLISGEAGIGKTRLQRELVLTARARGFRVLTGVCTERDREYPFAPFVDAIRQQQAEQREWLVPADLLAALGSLFPEIDPGEPTLTFAGSSTLPAEQQKRRVFEAFIVLLDRIARGAPLLLILEDLHWADPSTLELFELLPRRLSTAPVLVLATTRTDERNSNLVACLGTLRRQRSIVEIDLSRLEDRHVGSMLAAMTGFPAADAFVRSIHSRSDGNPFYIEELLTTYRSSQSGELATSEPVVPQTVREAVLQRLQQAAEPAREVAVLAAVIGKRFRFELLLAAGNLEPGDLSAALEELERMHILVRETAGESVFAFRHALTREVILTLTLIHQRVALHRQVGEALEVFGSEATDADLGFHFFMAHEWPRAVDYASRAGDSAWSLHSTAEALVHFRRALEAAQQIGDARATRLHLRCGMAHALLGSFDDAQQHLAEAARRSRLERDRSIEQEAIYELSGLYSSRDYREAQRLALEALAMARTGADQRQTGRALNRLGNMLTNLLEFDASRALHEEALGIFEGAGDRWGVADALDLIGMNHYLSGNVHEARPAFDRAARIFDELDDAERYASARTSQGCWIAVLDGPCASPVAPAVFRRDAEEGLRRCRSIGWRPGEAYALASVACAAIGAGHLDEALELAQSGLATARDIDHQQWSIICLFSIGLLHADMRDDASASGYFSEALSIAQTMGAAQWEQRARVWLERCRFRTGETAEARIALKRIAPSDGRATSIGERRAILTLAEMNLADGALSECRERLNQITEEQHDRRPPEIMLLRAKVLRASGETREADEALLHARKRASEIGPRSLLWRIAAERSLMWRELDHRLSEVEAACARAELEDYAGRLPEGDFRHTFLSLAEVRAWLPSARAPRTRRSSGPGGLTRREQDVAAKVADGFSNKEIAFELSIAEKTVEMHVSSCLGKLDLTSRTQLAGWFRERTQGPTAG